MEEKKRMGTARSRNNGILFCSNICPFWGIEATVNESGEIQALFVSVPEHDSNIAKIIFKRNDLWKIVAFDVLLVMLSLLAKSFLVTFAAIYFSIMVSLKLFIFVRLAYESKSKNGKLHSFAKFHAAEHMVVNAYNKYQRVPTFEEVKKSSRFNKDCGSNLIMCDIVLGLSISINDAIIGIIGNVFIEFILLFIMMCITLIVIIGGRKGWLKFFQYFITTPPTDKEIEVAIEGVKTFEKMENDFIKAGV